MNVVAFGDHLGADQQVQLPSIQRIQCAFKISVAANRITVQPRDSRLRELPVQQLFQLFRSGAEKIHVLAPAKPHMSSAPEP